jgi:hypothetical protein
MTDRPIIFREEQRRPVSHQVIIFLAAGGPSLLLLFGLMQQFVYEVEWAVIAGSVAVVALTLVAMIALLFSRLLVEVREDGVYYRFVPIHRSWKRIGASEIDRSFARGYNWINDSDEGGLRWSAGDRTYWIKGDRGVQLELADGRRMFLGSQRAEDLVAAVETIMDREPGTRPA